MAGANEFGQYRLDTLKSDEIVAHLVQFFFDQRPSPAAPRGILGPQQLGDFFEPESETLDGLDETNLRDGFHADAARPG